MCQAPSPANRNGCAEIARRWLPVSTRPRSGMACTRTSTWASAAPARSTTHPCPPGAPRPSTACASCPRCTRAPPRASRPTFSRTRLTPTPPEPRSTPGAPSTGTRGCGLSAMRPSTTPGTRRYRRGRRPSRRRRKGRTDWSAVGLLRAFGTGSSNPHCPLGRTAARRSGASLECYGRRKRPQRWRRQPTQAYRRRRREQTRCRQRPAYPPASSSLEVATRAQRGMSGPTSGS
mmetsp:Transcript_5829/g.19297  ORF Transcript_5829/g.19297 Transcript_5829/m.19297 type:complete len:233 (-) Transcript_5829:196-894(-)